MFYIIILLYSSQYTNISRMDWTLEFASFTNWRGEWKKSKWNFNTCKWRSGRWNVDKREKSTKKLTRESWNYLQTSELVSLWKENLSFLESSRCNKGWHLIQKEVSKLGHENPKLQCKNKIRNLKDIYKNAKLNNSKRGAAPQTCTFFDVFDEVLSNRDVVNIPEKKEVVFARQTS